MAGGLEMELLNVSHLKKIYTTRFGGTQVQALSDVNFPSKKENLWRSWERAAQEKRRF